MRASCTPGVPFMDTLRLGILLKMHRVENIFSNGIHFLKFFGFCLHGESVLPVFKEKLVC